MIKRLPMLSTGTDSPERYEYRLYRFLVLCRAAGLSSRQIRLLLQHARVPVDFLDDALDAHGFAVELHFLAVLC